MLIDDIVVLDAPDTWRSAKAKVGGQIDPGAPIKSLSLTWSQITGWVFWDMANLRLAVLFPGSRFHKGPVPPIIRSPDTTLSTSVSKWGGLSRLCLRFASRIV